MPSRLALHTALACVVLSCPSFAPDALAQDDAARATAEARTVSASLAPAQPAVAPATASPADAAEAASPAAPPVAAAQTPEESGIATYYAAEMQGQLTASGEPYDGAALTAAHRTLPLGTVVRVIDVASGRQVNVRINDRWGGGSGRVINLSHRAAQDLGFGRAGQLRVSLVVETLGTGRVGAAVPSGERLPALLDASASPRRLVCENQGKILGLRDAFLRNHVTNCMQRASR